MFCSIVLNTLCVMGALAFADASVVVPFAAIHLVFTVILAIVINGEFVSLRSWSILIFISIGITCTVIGANKETIDYSVDDMMNLYYGYKLKEQFRKKIEKELEKEKESHARTQENYNDVAIESSEHEDTIDKLEFIKYKYECIIIGTLLLLFISNVILSIYLYKGPTLLYNDTISFCCNIGYCIYLCWSFLKIIIDFSISLYTDVPEYVRCIYLIIILSMSVFIYKYDISFSMILEKSEEMFNNIIKVSLERLVNCKDFIKNRYILLFSSSEKNKKKC